MNAELARIVNAKSARGYFITEEDLPAIVQADRLCPLLVRCGGGRFTCPAQDVKHFIDIIEQHAADHSTNGMNQVGYSTDHVRDVSFTCNTVDEAREFLKVTP